MKRSRFEEIYGDNRQIKLDSPEWKFIQLITLKRSDEAVKLFPEVRRYGEGFPKVDTPYGAYEGTDGIRQMADGWFDVFGAVSAHAVPVMQTRAGGRSVTELVLHYVMQDGKEWAVPMAAVAELSGKSQMDELRLYYHWRMVPGSPAYRPPAFPEKKDQTTRQEMLSGAVKDYFLYLHDPKGGIIERADRIFADVIVFGGYEPRDVGDGLQPVKLTDFIGQFAKGIGHTLANYVKLRMETIIDDGKICCVEWEQMVTKAGREEAGRISQAGISFYERDDDGRIWSVRIIDYAYAEKEIDWSWARKTKEEAERINYLG